MTYYTKADEAAKQFFKAQAKKEGMSYTAWCRKNGILDAAALHRISRNEESRDARGGGSLFVSVEEWTREYKEDGPKRGSSGVTSGEDCANLQHDAGGIVGPPNAARRRPSRSDAAEAAD